MSTPYSLLPNGPGAPSPPIAIAGGPAGATPHLAANRVDVPAGVMERLTSACAEVTVDAPAVAEASRDWWPLAMAWATDGQVAGLAGAVARPAEAEPVAAVLAICNEAGGAGTAAGGRSGGGGASGPLPGGVGL